jgi:hypothetical protein
VRTKLTDWKSNVSQELWNDVDRKLVKVLPHGLDGLVAFTVRVDKADHKTRRKVLSSDGRRWLKDSTTSWTGYGRLRFANCRGSMICNNKNCPYRKDYGVINKLCFDKDNKCNACGEHADSVPCPARRYVQIKETKLNIFHCGIHTCSRTRKAY